MERLIEDADNIKKLLPWIESQEDIINFMRKIPLNQSHIRNQLTLYYFLKLRDSNFNTSEKKIEDDAREIVLIMPDVSYKKIKEKLRKLGNIPNRKEIVVRQLIYKQSDLEKKLRDINVFPLQKRKIEPNDDIFGLNSSDSQTDINIKIRRRDGSLEVVSRILSHEMPTTSQNLCVPQELLEEPSTSSTSVCTSIGHCSNDSPDSTVPPPDSEPNNHLPGFTADLNDFIDPVPSTSECEMSRASAKSIAKKKSRHSIGLDHKSDEVIEIPSNKRKSIDLGVISGPNSTVTTRAKSPTVKKFDLVNFLKEISLASELKIFQLCKNMKLDLKKKPNEKTLNYLLNQLLDDVVVVPSADSSENDSDVQENNEYRIEQIFTSGPLSDTLPNPRFVLNDFVAPPARPPQTIIQPARFHHTSGGKLIIPATSTNFCKVPDTSPPAATGFSLPQFPVDLTSSPAVADPVSPTTSKDEDTPMSVDDETLFENDESVDEPRPGPSTSGNEKKRMLDQNLVLRLIEMFPEACSDYIRELCDGKQWSDLDNVVTEILSAPSYPRRPERQPSPSKDMDPEEQCKIVSELLPDADPTYIRMQCEKFANNEKGLKEFIDHAMEHKDYPTMKEYLRKQQLSAQLKQYTSEFKVENFVQLFPDPEKTFNDPNRTVKMGPMCAHYLNFFFRNRFDRVSTKVIQNVLTEKKFRTMACEEAFQAMVKKNVVMKSRRKPSPLPENLQNIPLLQELAYLTHKEEILRFLEDKKKAEEQERIEAKKNGLMENCQCCYDEEVMPKDIVTCPSGCKFCKDCVKRSCEVALGEGKTQFSCLENCSNEFTLQTLQNALPPKMFSKLAQKKALAEIKAAGIEDLETCPFCDFASIPNGADKIFRCLNPDCMKESCRQCKEPNHIPLKCEEVEKDEDVKARTYIENKMTEALIRKCWKCGTSFFKEEGCNKMTCSCGAMMCYICQKPVNDYTHFNGIGGDKYQLCPLYSDSNLINQQNVMGAAAAAKAEIDPNKLKVDPTVGIQDHFNTRARELPREPHLEVLQRLNRAEARRRQHRRRHNDWMLEVQQNNPFDPDFALQHNLMIQYIRDRNERRGQNNQ